MPSIQLRVAAATVAALSLLAPPTDAETLPGASDTAFPNWHFDGRDQVRNWFDCNGSTCSFRITSYYRVYSDDPHPCAVEAIAASSVPGPALAYEDTWCSVEVSGTLEAQPGVLRELPCTIKPKLTDDESPIEVVFSSGVNSAFNGRFSASAAFTGTDVRHDSLIRTGTLTLRGGSSLEERPGVGEIHADITVTFLPSVLRHDCVGTGYFVSAAGSTTRAPWPRIIAVVLWRLGMSSGNDSSADDGDLGDHIHIQLPA